MKTINYLSETIIDLPCFEPAGRTVPLTGEDLTRNVMLTGSVGSGKTTTLNEILFQLLSYRAAEQEGKIGMLIFDFKQDDSVQNLLAMARACNREQDVQLVREDSAFRMELFDNFNSIMDLESVLELFLTVAPQESSDNKYWEFARRKRLRTGLGLLRLVSDGNLDTFEVFQFLNSFLTAHESGPSSSDKASKALAEFQNLLSVTHQVGLNPFLEATITNIREGLSEWHNLDSRTRSNELSTFSNMMDSLTSPAAFSLFSGKQRKAINMKQIVDNGAIIVISVSATRLPTFAKMIGKLAKSMFYEVVQSRQLGYADKGRLVGMIMDEYPLIATSGDGRYCDVTQLQAMRSMRGFAIAATQGFNAIERKIGPKETQALLAQFNQHFLFKTNEPEVVNFAANRWGMKRSIEVIQPPNSKRGDEFGAGYAPQPMQQMLIQMQPVCSQNALLKLEPNECFVWSSATAEDCHPFHLVPRYSISSLPDASGETSQGNHSELRQTMTSQEQTLRKLAGITRDDQAFASIKPLNQNEPVKWTDIYPQSFASENPF